MLANKFKTVLLAGLILLAVGLVGCDRHRHNRRNIRASRGNDVHYGGRRYSSNREKSSRGGGSYKSNRSGKSRRHQSALNVKKKSGRSKSNVKKSSQKSRRSSKASVRKKDKSKNTQKLQKIKTRRRFALARGDRLGANPDILRKQPDGKKNGSKSSRTRRKK